MRKKLDPVLVILSALALGIVVTAAASVSNEKAIDSEKVAPLQRGVYLSNNE